jgi:integrase
MYIEKITGARGTKYRCHVEKVNAKTGEEVRKSKAFALRSAAEQWGRDKEYELSQGKFIDTRQVDSQELAQYIQKYIEHITPGEQQMQSKVGWKREVDRLKVWLNNPLTSRPISKITHVDMLDHIRHRRRSHSKQVKPGATPKFISEQTIKHELVVLSNVYTFVDVYYQLEGLVNPVRTIPKGLKPGVSREIEVRILPEDWERLSILLGNRRNKMYVYAAELAIETAMRQGELLRLEPKHVHLAPTDNYVTAMDFRQEGGKVVGYARNIPLSTRAADILK